MTSVYQILSFSIPGQGGGFFLGGGGCHMVSDNWTLKFQKYPIMPKSWFLEFDPSEVYILPGTKCKHYIKSLHTFLTVCMLTVTLCFSDQVYAMNQ